MDELAYSTFERVYLEVVGDLLASLTEEMQREIARHNIEWMPGRTDFHGYFLCSAGRYYRAYRAIVNGGACAVCDVGGFLGVLPVTLARLGVRAAMTETRKYYSDAFEPLFGKIERYGVALIDLDPFTEVAATDQRFDAVLLMAVLEHYPHSYRTIMENVARLLTSGGLLYIEVPNIAYWPKRWALLFGHSPLVAPDVKYESRVPFIGHHNEFSAADLGSLVDLGGFEILNQQYYNYSRFVRHGMEELLWRLNPRGWRENMEDVIFALFPKTRECMSVACRPKVR